MSSGDLFGRECLANHAPVEMSTAQSNKRCDFDELTTRLKLQRHPEGGFFAETHRADVTVRVPASEYGNGDSDQSEQSLTVVRSASTAIYFALCGADFSAFHRIRSDEVWHFYHGAPIEVIVIDAESGALTSTLLGSLSTPGATCQFVVKRNQWFASRLAAQHAVSTDDDVALVGCTVAPGFDFADFELAARDQLVAAYPQHADIIRELTRQ